MRKPIASKNVFPNWIVVTALFIVPIVSFIVDKATSFMARNEMIATKPYVDDKANEVTLAAKERERAVLEKAIEHSDRNHDDMVIRMKDISSDVRAIGVKIDVLTEDGRVARKKRAEKSP